MVVGFIRGRWINSGAPCESLGSFGNVWFIWVLPGGHWVHFGTLDSFGCALSLFGVVGFIRVCLRHCRVHSGVRFRLLVCTLVVVGFVGFIWVRSEGH